MGVVILRGEGGEERPSERDSERERKRERARKVSIEHTCAGRHTQRAHGPNATTTRTSLEDQVIATAHRLAPAQCNANIHVLDATILRTHHAHTRTEKVSINVCA